MATRPSREAARRSCASRTSRPLRPRRALIALALAFLALFLFLPLVAVFVEALRKEALGAYWRGDHRRRTRWRRSG